jgi:hypothetical protein
MRFIANYIYILTEESFHPYIKRERNRLTYIDNYINKQIIFIIIIFIIYIQEEEKVPV